ncbi:VID27-like protein [Larimichthys crocea]|uniref:VID27-like protein n=1 Tax=Larimichthys crocea TaxID=215358 RepID=UPI000F5DA83C|nr:VID27-like protein [Larimichthys crocea]
MERIQQQSSDSPEPSCASMQSDSESLAGLIDFKGKHGSLEKSTQVQGPDSSEPGCVNMQSDSESIAGLIDFKNQHHSAKNSTQDEMPGHPPSCVSMDDQSIGGLIDFKDPHHAFENVVHQEGSEATSYEPVEKHQPDLESIFMLLEETIIQFVKNELKTFQRVLSSDNNEDSEEQKKTEDMVDSEEKEEQWRSSRGAFLKITLNVLRRMKQEELADCLQSKAVVPVCQETQI